MRQPVFWEQVMLLGLWLAVLGACTVPPTGQTVLPEQENNPAALLAELDSPPEQAGGLLRGPVLRLDTGMHTAAILSAWMPPIGTW